MTRSVEIAPGLFTVPGADALVRVNKSRMAPGWWSYLITDGTGNRMIATDAIEIPAEGSGITPEQVARIAFLLECEYGKCDCGQRCPEDTYACCFCGRRV